MFRYTCSYYLQSTFQLLYFTESINENLLSCSKDKEFCDKDEPSDKPSGDNGPSLSEMFNKFVKDGDIGEEGDQEGKREGKIVNKIVLPFTF